jgi:5'-nucleotidase / UDP-sugar diphosphatase
VRTLATLLLVLAVACGRPTAPDRGSDGAELHLTILHTSDEHSALLPTPIGPDGVGGIARLATVVGEERARKAALGEPVLVTSAGDFLTGTPFAWLALDGRGVELALMREVGYDVVTLGNHEFDYGPERLAGYLAAGLAGTGGRTPLVATNLRIPDGHPLGALDIPTTRLDTLMNGVRVGWIGVLGAGAARVAPGAAPVTFAPAAEAAATAEAALRAAGAHVVIAVTHAGITEDRALARAVPGVDLVLGGHDHVLLDEPLREGRTLIVHPGAHLRQLVRLELAVDTLRPGIRLRDGPAAAPHVVPLDGGVRADPPTAERVAELRLELDALLERVTAGRWTTTSTVVRGAFPLRARPPVGETTMGNLVTDAMRAGAASATGRPVDIAFQANGSIRGDLLVGAGPDAEATLSFYDLARTVGLGSGPDSLPGYPLVAVWLTGEEVRRVLEVSALLSTLMGSSYHLQVSGLRVRYDPARSVVARIPFSGTPIPSGRAVLSVARETAEGPVPIERGDTTLFHVVTDRYVASFLPMVGRVVPRLVVAPKDASGATLAEIDDAIVRTGGRELKVWESVAMHASQEPSIPARYAGPEGRLVVVRTLPLWIAPAVFAALLLAAVVVLLLRRRRRRTGPSRAGSA